MDALEGHQPLGLGILVFWRCLFSPLMAEGEGHMAQKKGFTVRERR